MLLEDVVLLTVEPDVRLVELVPVLLTLPVATLLRGPLVLTLPLVPLVLLGVPFASAPAELFTVRLSFFVSCSASDSSSEFSSSSSSSPSSSDDSSSSAPSSSSSSPTLVRSNCVRRDCLGRDDSSSGHVRTLCNILHDVLVVLFYHLIVRFILK